MNGEIRIKVLCNDIEVLCNDIVAVNKLRRYIKELIFEQDIYIVLLSKADTRSCARNMFTGICLLFLDIRRLGCIQCPTCLQRYFSDLNTHHRFQSNLYTGS